MSALLTELADRAGSARLLRDRMKFDWSHDLLYDVSQEDFVSFTTKFATLSESHFQYGGCSQVVKTVDCDSTIAGSIPVVRPTFFDHEPQNDHPDWSFECGLMIKIDS